MNLIRAGLKHDADVFVSGDAVLMVLTLNADVLLRNKVIVDCKLRRPAFGDAGGDTLSGRANQSVGR